MTARIVLILAAAAVAVVIAMPPESEPAGQQQNPWFVQDCAGPDENLTGPYGTVTRLPADGIDRSLVSGTPGERQQGDRGIGLRPFMDWGNDVLVATLFDDPSWGRVSIDEAPNGDLYVGILDPDDGADNDSAFIYRSTNGGGSWTLDHHLSSTVNHDIKDFCLRIGSDANGVWIYDFIVYGGTGIYVRRARPGLSPSWIQVQPGDTFVAIDADRNIENPQHLFILYQTVNDRIKRMSSSDSAQTWGNFGNVASNAARTTCHAGGDGYVYLGFHENDSSIIWLGRYTNNMISPSFTWNQLDTTNNNGCWNVSVAGARTTPGASQVAVAMWSRRNTNDNIPPYYGYTQDGGVSWLFSFWPVTNQTRTTWDARYPAVRQSYVDPAALFRATVTMHEPSADWDTIVYAYTTTADPTSWQERATPNDFRQTSEYGAAVDRSNIVAGGVVVYRLYAASDIYIDGYNTIGVAEGERPAAGQPTPVRVATLLGPDSGVRLSLARAARVSALLRDGTGRVVERVHEGLLETGEHALPLGQGLSAGIYFLDLSIDGERQTTKLVRLQ